MTRYKFVANIFALLPFYRRRNGENNKLFPRIEKARFKQGDESFPLDKKGGRSLQTEKKKKAGMKTKNRKIFGFLLPYSKIIPE